MKNFHNINPSFKIINNEDGKAFIEGSCSYDKVVFKTNYDIDLAHNLNQDITIILITKLNNMIDNYKDIIAKPYLNMKSFSNY